VVTGIQGRSCDGLLTDQEFGWMCGDNRITVP
jgi:hypothetical protein